MSVIDWAVVGVYLFVVLLIGLRSSDRVKRVFDYFLGSRSFGVLPIALSIIATETSAATIIGGPDTAYRGNLAYLQTTIGAVLSRAFLAFFFIDVYYRARVYTVYSYLAQRFDNRVQVLASLLYSLARVLASGARLYIAGLAIGTIASIDIYAAIVLISVVGIVYAAKGGLPAVIWTDCLQAFIFLGVGLYSIFFVIHSAGGVTSVWELLAHSGKLQIFELRWDLFNADFWRSPYTFLGAVLGGFTLGVATHGTDQDNVQRMLAGRTSLQGRLSLVVAALLEIPTAVIFVTLGSVLWVFYQQPGNAPPPVNESVYPYFIRTAVPEGLRGLFVAGILAAAMSSLNSVLNALASVSLTDLYIPFKRGIRAGCVERGSEDYGVAQFAAGVTEESAVRISRWHTVVWGVILMCTAFWLGARHQALLAARAAASGDPSRSVELLTLALGVMSVVYGPLLAIFLIAIFTKRGNLVSLSVGTVAGLAATISLQLCPSVQVGWTWQTIIGCVIAFILGVIDRPFAKASWRVLRCQ